MPPKPPKKPARRQMGRYRLAVVRGPREDGRWYWRAREHANGGEQTVWTGWATLREADEAVGQIVAGISPTESTDCATVGDLLSLWHGSIEARQDLSVLTVRGYACSAKRLKKVLSLTATPRLDRAAVERFRDTSLKQGNTTRTVRCDLMVLGLAWRWGRELGLTPDKELPRVGLKVPELAHARPPTDSIMAAIEKFAPAPRMHALLLAATGARRIEVAQLSHGDVTERDGRLWIGLNGKGGRARETPIHKDIEDELRAWIETHPGRPEDALLGYTAQTCIQYLHRAIHAAGETWTPHDLRRGNGRPLPGDGAQGIQARFLGGPVERGRQGQARRRRPGCQGGPVSRMTGTETGTNMRTTSTDTPS